eukprot:scaffold22441_cov75-Skeletonema_dohrnii-CCMP3373.AAC.2
MDDNDNALFLTPFTEASSLLLYMNESLALCLIQLLPIYRAKDYLDGAGARHLSPWYWKAPAL